MFELAFLATCSGGGRKGARRYCEQGCLPQSVRTALEPRTHATRTLSSPLAAARPLTSSVLNKPMKTSVQPEESGRSASAKAAGRRRACMTLHTPSTARRTSKFWSNRHRKLFPLRQT